MHRSIRLLALPLFAAALTVGCDDTPTPTNPDPVTPPIVTDTFQGSVTPNGASVHSFAVGAAGQVTASLTTVGPDSTTVIGLALGTWNGTACNVVLANDAAKQGAVIIGQASNAGNLCVRLYDVGSLAAAATYTVTVTHF